MGAETGADVEIWQVNAPGLCKMDSLSCNITSHLAKVVEWPPGDRQPCIYLQFCMYLSPS